MILSGAAFLAAPAAWPQETETADPQASAAEASIEESSSDEAADDIELDEQSYADAEEEDFVPSEDIPVDQAIAFPTDI